MYACRIRDANDRVSAGEANVDDATDLMINLFWRGLKGAPGERPA